jgi:hypothetical protein
LKTTIGTPGPVVSIVGSKSLQDLQIAEKASGAACAVPIKMKASKVTIAVVKKLILFFSNFLYLFIYFL